MSLEVMRGGKNSTKRWGPGFHPALEALENAVHFRCLINYGRGMSDIDFSVSPEHFVELAELMIMADRDAAARAFGLAVAKGFEDDGAVAPSGS